MQLCTHLGNVKTLIECSVGGQVGLQAAQARGQGCCAPERTTSPAHPKAQNPKPYTLCIPRLFGDYIGEPPSGRYIQRRLFKRQKAKDFLAGSRQKISSARGIRFNS